jgi:hypothetical protein
MTRTADSLLARLKRRDLTLWPEDSVAPNRLGWIDSPEWCLSRANDLQAWAETVEQQRVILLGMGGSALGPLVLSGRNGRGGKFTDGRRSLTVIDTTSAITIADLNFDDAVVVVSSKSGTTLETEVLLAYAFERIQDPRRFVIVTDEGSPLAETARQLGVTAIFENPTDIGGRFSMFSYFGMVPAALLGYDVAQFCSAALATDLGEAAELGENLGLSVLRGQDKLFITSHPDVPRFGLWAEQLIAESTGKDGTGCIPVPTKAATSAPDRFVLSMPFDDVSDLAQAFYGLEISIAICGSILFVDPFNEPNVAEAKSRTLDRLDGTSHAPIATLPVSELKSWLRSVLHRGSYLTVQAYFPLDQEAALDDLRELLASNYRPVAVTSGFGPRYLHSTGQLHKGGPSSVVALQVLAEHSPEVAIPQKSFTFNELLAAQADGDHDALVARGRTVARVVVSDIAALTMLLRS